MMALIIILYKNRIIVGQSYFYCYLKAGEVNIWKLS